MVITTALNNKGSLNHSKMFQKCPFQTLVPCGSMKLSSVDAASSKPDRRIDGSKHRFTFKFN